MKIFQAVLGVISMGVLLTIVILIKKNMNPQKMQKAFDMIDEVKVTQTLKKHLGNANIRETLYAIERENCQIHWRFRTYTLNEKIEQRANLAYPYDVDCTLSFKEQLPLHRQILKRAFIDWDKKQLSGFGTGSLQTLDQSYYYNKRVIKAATNSEAIMDYKRNYPHHKSRTSSNHLLINLINKNNIFPEIKKLFKELGVNIKLVSCEKVFTMTRKQIEAIGIALPSGVRTMFSDAARFEYEVFSTEN